MQVSFNPISTLRYFIYGKNMNFIYGKKIFMVRIFFFTHRVSRITIQLVFNITKISLREVRRALFIAVIDSAQDKHIERKIIAFIKRYIDCYSWCRWLL